MSSSNGRTPLGEILREVRRSLNLSQEELARRADVSVAVIRKIEQGVAAGKRQEPSFRVVASLAHALGMPLQALDAGQAAAVRRPRSVRLYLSENTGLREGMQGTLLLMGELKRIRVEFTRTGTTVDVRPTLLRVVEGPPAPKMR